MEWIFNLPIELLVVTIFLVLALGFVIFLYVDERKQNRQLADMIRLMQAQIDSSFDIARKQSESAIFVLHRVLTAREKEEIGLDTTD